MYKIFYHPDDITSVAADFIPFYDNGVFHLFYLYDGRDKSRFGEGVPWYKISTTDFVDFKDHGEMIGRGSLTDYDPYVFTGSVIKHEGQYHAFYTAHNPYIKDCGDYYECIMHAVSDDLENWEKIPEEKLLSPDGYSKCDFRDPFVFFNEEENVFWMLICAKNSDGNAIRNGVTLTFQSKDLKNWEKRDELFAPNQFFAHECPDLFMMNGWWYLIFSEYSDRNIVRYRKAQSLNGPWLKPKKDYFDGRAFYAAKTASDGNKRYLFGWNPTRENNNDNGNWQWGGNLVVHELIQTEEADLAVKPPESILNAFSKEIIKDVVVNLESPYTTETITILENAPEIFKLSAEINYQQGSSQLGFLLHHNPVLDEAFGITINLDNNMISVNQFPNFPQNKFNEFQLQQPIPADETYKVDILIDHDVCVIYVNSQTALNTRFYNKKGSNVSVFSSNSNVRFSDVSISTL